MFYLDSFLPTPAISPIQGREREMVSILVISGYLNKTSIDKVA